MRVECAGKQTYPSRSAAERVAKIGRRRKDAPLQAYFCRTCRAYHVGNHRIIRRSVT